MRFSLRTSAFAVLAIASVAANAQSIKFWFSDNGGDNSRLLTDVIGPGQSKWYDVILANVGSTPLVFNSGVVMIGLGVSSAAGTGATANVTPAKVNVHDPSQPNGAMNIANPAPWFTRAFAADMRGGRNPSGGGTNRPWGHNTPIDMAPGTTQTLAAGDTIRLYSIQLRENGFIGQDAFWDVFIYDAGSGSSGTSAMLNGATAYRPGSGSWADDSRLRLTPEPGTMLALAAGIGALAARRRRKA
jgi:hypothetical protein